MIRKRLLEDVDIASLVFFRIAFGCLLFIDLVKALATGWVKRCYIEPTFHFHYLGFDWVHPWPGWGMIAHYVTLCILSLCVAAGLFYRAATALLCLGLVYVFVLEQAEYLNHYYLICLMCFLMFFVPANRAASIDVLRKPALRANRVPAWSIWLLRALIGIVYFYAGVAKLNPDWIRAQPIGMWLSMRSAEHPMLRMFLMREDVGYLFAYGGLLLDLFIAPALLYKPTRLVAFGFGLFFHLMNSWLFKIGIFPWFMIGATLIYFEPSWPRFGPFKEKESSAAETSSVPIRLGAPAAAVLGLFFFVQLLLPLRHYLYPGNVYWTEEGNRFAWHMLVRHKTAWLSPFLLRDSKTQQEWHVDPKEYLTDWQVARMKMHPTMLLQASHLLAREWKKKGYEDVQVYASVRASLNGRRPEPLIDPKVDLAKEPYQIWHDDWIMPMKQDMPNPYDR